MTSLRISLAYALLFVTASSSAADTALDTAKSTLGAEFTQLGVPVNAPFKKFSGSIAYNAAKPAEAKAHLDIDTTSLDIGDDYNAELRKKEWFDTAQFPQASFDAAGLKPLGGNKFEAAGKLTLKGRSKALTVPVTIVAAGGTTSIDGRLTLSRKEFGIGDPAWNDVLEDGVTVKFHIVVPAPH